ncbi:MAG: helix-turn-helix transcriptional regulator [Clostridia bacterium]|nr:helix-turn-helix transcriptional regulator [Clostridia bacterium]
MRIREQSRGTKNLCGRKIEELRREKGILQKEMLESLALQGVVMTAPVLSKIEGQHRTLNDYELLAIANTLDVSIDDLLGRTGEKLTFEETSSSVFEEPSASTIPESPVIKPVEIASARAEAARAEAEAAEKEETEHGDD